MDLLTFFNAEYLWPFVTRRLDIPRNDSYTDFYRSARNFGELCAIIALQKATPCPHNRPIDYEFVDIYNGMTKAILATLEMNEEKISMTKLGIIASYISPSFTPPETYKKGIDIVTKGDISGVYVFDINLVEEERRKKVIASFASCLKSFINFYGLNETKKITVTRISTNENEKKL